MINAFKRLKYPKLALLILIYIAAGFLLYEEKTVAPLHEFMLSFGYAGIFVAGVFYAYAFTAAPATAVLLILAENNNPVMAGLIGGMGALMSDLLIYFIVRNTFIDEVRMLTREKAIRFIVREEKKVFGKLQKYIATVLAAILIASPLPTEIGVSMLASQKSMHPKKFMVIAFLLHTVGITFILLIGHSL